MGNLRRASGLLRYALFWGLECTSKRVHSDTTGANEQGRRQRRLLRKTGAVRFGAGGPRCRSRVDFRVAIEPARVTRQLPIAIRLEATSAA